jgi:hypothetical protein
MTPAAPIYRSCFVLDKTRTIREHKPLTETEELMAWIKDAAAGAGLLIFIASSFVLAAHVAVLGN